MSFGNITDLPTLVSYEQALKHYESIKPLRGSDDVRPLCKGSNGRRKKQYRIVTTVIDGVHAVACRMYNTDVVRFLKNGEIQIATDGWHSTSTMSFINGILIRQWDCDGLHLSACVRGGTTLISYTVPTAEGHQTHHSRMPEAREPLRFTADADGFITLINRPKATRHYVDRGKMNEVRSRNKEFLAYVRRMWKVLDTSPDALQNLRREYTFARAVNPSTREQLESGDMVQWNLVAQYLYAGAVKDTYVRETYNYTRTLALADINKEISKMLRNVYEDEILFEKEVHPTVLPD